MIKSYAFDYSSGSIAQIRSSGGFHVHQGLIADIYLSLALAVRPRLGEDRLLVIADGVYIYLILQDRMSSFYIPVSNVADISRSAAS